MQFDSPTSEPYTFPPLGNLATSAREPTIRPPGRWERGVWMLCFWFTFLVTLLQLSVGGLFIYATVKSDRPLFFTGNRLVWQLAHETSFVLDCMFSVLTAPLMLYAFDKARTHGLQLSWYFIAWLLTRCLFTATFLICAFVLWLEKAGRYEQLMVFGFLRVVVFNLPFAAMLPGLLLVHAERQYPPETPDAKLTEPEEPINPLA
jgi:hypothetical protein